MTASLLLPATRSESEIRLGRLMAAIDDAESACGWYSVTQAVDRIFEAKHKYDAARLREGGTP